jgi:tetratricopeptide (TPR) repeat protein
MIVFIPVAGNALRAQDDPHANRSALLEAENKVSLKQGGADWTPFKALPTPLAIGDRVRTGDLSRATVRLTDLSVLRMDELTSIEILPPANESGKEGLDISAGATYFFSREKPRELQVRTPSATGALRGTEFVVRVEGGRTRMIMLDGEVELSNANGSVVLHSGESGEAAIGEAPRKTAAIEAANIIQWTLCYPGVLDAEEIGLGGKMRGDLDDSVTAYAQGDLLGALKTFPAEAADSHRLYHAAVLLAVGRVDEAKIELAGVPAGDPGRNALEEMIAAVTLQAWTAPAAPRTAGEWMAASYYKQSKGDLEGARAAALAATKAAPNSGYAWTRLAELQFSFGRIPPALDALNRGLALSPRNAQAWALRGFLLSAQNEIPEARAAFNQAIDLDGALGNAWLGRGLTLIREGHDEEGRRDLQTAAALEPNRSILRSYLGKAFSDVGNAVNAAKDLKRAKQLDPRDPTPWLYSAIEAKQENRYNDAIDDLQTSVDLNDNRRIYRSRLLLDQDKSIRGTNLAAIYLNDGMVEQSVREAVLSVDADYDSAPAHLFLANSYNALRDPTRILLRYETPWFNELLLSNLLSPVGGGPLSQFVTEQEYSKMFEQDGFGGSSDFTYLSNGEYRETASQYGTFGNFSYALDAQYLYENGQRANNQISSIESYASFKYQITPEDTLFAQTQIEDQTHGNSFQLYDNTVNLSTADTTERFHEDQYPGLILLGLHHQWSPGNDTLLLGGRLENHQVQTGQDAPQLLVGRDVYAETFGLGNGLGNGVFNDPFSTPSVTRTLRSLTGTGAVDSIDTLPLNYDYNAKFETYTGEIQQIITPVDDDTVIFGGRYQTGEFGTTSDLYGTPAELMNVNTAQTTLFNNALSQQFYNVGLQRINFYLYDTWHPASWVSLTGGATYDDLTFPQNFRSPPIDSQKQTIKKVSPKVGIILQPSGSTVIRAAYTQAVSGASFDESVRLEPTEVAGFTQAYRELASESVVGSMAGNVYDLLGVSVEQKLPTRTFLGLEYDDLRQNNQQTLGAFDYLTSENNYPAEILPSSLGADDRYREQILTGTINQLVGQEWSFGARYQYTVSQLNQQEPDLQSALNAAGGRGTTLTGPALTYVSSGADANAQSSLGQLDLTALYNSPTGFFSTADAKWYKQYNEVLNARSPGSSDFWQFDWIVGYRFYRNQCEVSGGVLDLNGENYKLDPLNPYEDLPRSRTFVLRAKFAF